MSEQNYAFIKGTDIVNIAIFDNPDYATITYFKEFHELDEIIACPEYVFTGCTYNNGLFILPQPYPSWTLNSIGGWDAPVLMPEQEEGSSKIYVWDEPTLSWVVEIPEITE